MMISLINSYFKRRILGFIDGIVSIHMMKIQLASTATILNSVDSFSAKGD